MKKFILILLALSLVFVSCNLRENTIEKKDVKLEQPEPEQQNVINKKQRDEQEALKDSLKNILLKRYPSALNVDSVRRTYTYVFQELLEKSSYLLYIKNAHVRDVEGTNRGYYLLTVYNYSPEIVGKFKVYPEVLERLLKELNPKSYRNGCCLVVKVKDLTPIKTDVALNIDEFDNAGESKRVSEEDIRNNVHLGLDSGTSQFYFMKGELIDFYLLK